MKSDSSLGILNYSIIICSFIFFICVSFARAETPKIVDFKLNGEAGNVIFNPNTGDEVSIEIKANKPVKFTRIYICATTQLCTSSSGNYTRYFTSGDISESIVKIWNGKVSSASNAGFAPAGEYKVKISMAEEGQDTISEFGQFSIFLDPTSSASTTAKTEEYDDGVDSEISNSGEISTHSSTADLSNYKDSYSKFKISAGRERLSYVNFPIKFSAQSNLSSNEPVSFEWSFGDGYEERGEVVYHTYKTEGEYNVVLNGLNGSEESISRTKIKILKADLNLVKINDNDFSIKNNGDYEINIGDLKIQKGYQVFNIAKDTIIPAKKSIVLSEVFKDLSGEPVILKTSSSFIVAETKDPEKKQPTLKQNLSNLLLDKEIVLDDKDSGVIISKLKSLTEQNKPVNKEIISQEVINSSVSILKSDDATSTTSIEDDSQVLQKKSDTDGQSLWRKIIFAPISFVRNIKNSFYESE